MSPPAFIFHIIPSKLKTSEDLKDLEAFPFISSQDKNRGFHCAFKEKAYAFGTWGCLKKWDLAEHISVEDSIVYLCMNGKYLDLQETQIQISTSPLILEILVASCILSEVEVLTPFFLFMDWGKRCQRRKVYCPRIFLLYLYLPNRCCWCLWLNKFYRYFFSCKTISPRMSYKMQMSLS